MTMFKVAAAAIISEKIRDTKSLISHVAVFPPVFVAPQKHDFSAFICTTTGERLLLVDVPLCAGQPLDFTESVRPTLMTGRLHLWNSSLVCNLTVHWLVRHSGVRPTLSEKSCNFFLLIYWLPCTNEWKQQTFHLLQGLRHFNATDYKVDKMSCNSRKCLVICKRAT